MKILKSKTAAVTGAASGIGRMLAVNLANEGCNLALADINAPGLQETAKLVGDRVKVTTHIVDVSGGNRSSNMPMRLSDATAALISSSTMPA